ncbi:MAG: TonB-dependent receptor plug domain-containing protein [Bacteroidales bacterium]|nr:TonB-dependent receptor plug domain-containing protein [Bacteroidales bacterium]
MKAIKYLSIIMAAALCVACGASQNATSTNQDDILGSGFASTKKSQNNFAIQQETTDDKETATYSNIYDYLAGRFPGLSVEGGNKLVIRGQASVNGDTEPLILIDGIEGPLDLVKPQDVENVTVIKDGSSAMYGFRAAGGVILIQTKGNKK